LGCREGEDRTPRLFFLPLDFARWAYPCKIGLPMGSSAEYNRQYRQDNLVRLKAREHERYAENKERECARVREYNRTHSKEIKAKRKKAPYESIRKKNLRQYGMSLEDYDFFLEKQGGVCAICKKPEVVVESGKAPRTLHVDHCHSTLRVRGLLCQRCNLMVGLSKDSSAILRDAADYLEKSWA
jgi:hypothetical protein